MEELRDKLSRAIADAFFDKDKYGNWNVVATFPSYIIISCGVDKKGDITNSYDKKVGTCYKKIPYSVSDEGEVDLEEPISLELKFKEVDESLIEALNESEGGAGLPSLLVGLSSRSGVASYVTGIKRIYDECQVEDISSEVSPTQVMKNSFKKVRSSK